LGSSAALGRIVERYRPALRIHLTRQHGYSADEADDVLQGFIAEQLVQRRILRRANPDRGRFRSFMLASLENYSHNHRRRTGRHPPSSRLSTQADSEPAAPAPHPMPDSDFEMIWARQVLSQAIQHMEQTCREASRPELWELFDCRILAPALNGTPPLDYDQIVQRFGFRTATEAGNRLITAKRMFLRSLRSVIGQYVSSQEDIEGELDDLRRILGT
jgi:RNA polymerase sigma-70 factor (ECF subfamily)